MQLHVIHTGFFKLDGGALFGVVPKVLWQKTTPADENNLCPLAMRCLLIEDGDRLILIDNGLGEKQDEKFLKHYYLHGEYSLENSLYQAGFKAEDITDVFLTHLHFDHCGGGVRFADADRTRFELVFPNARYWSNQDHWDWAVQPNARERASFLKENILPMQESGHLHFIEPDQPSPFTQFDILFVDGHTDKQMLPVISYKGKKLVFIADLVPTVGHIPLAWVPAFDTRPLLTLDEKKTFFDQVFTDDYILFFEHDPEVECCTLKNTEKGARLSETFKLTDI